MLTWLERFLKQLAAADIVKETDIDEYAPNAVSTLLASPPAQGAIINWCVKYNHLSCQRAHESSYDGLALTTPKFAEFLQKTKYQNPTDKDNSPWNFATNSPVHYFDWVFAP